MYTLVAAALARQRKICCCCADAAGDTESICIPLNKYSGAPKIWELNLVLAEATATRTRHRCCHTLEQTLLLHQCSRRHRKHLYPAAPMQRRPKDLGAKSRDGQVHTATTPASAAVTRHRILCCCADAAEDTEHICIPLHQCSGAPKLWELNPELADAKATATVSAAVHVSANCAAAPMQPERDP